MRPAFASSATTVVTREARPSLLSRFSGRIFLTRAAAIPFFALLLVTEDRWDTACARWHIDEMLVALGLTAVTVAILGRLWCTLYIGGRKTATLVMQGPYSLCRNPLYFFSAVGLIGLVATTSMLTLTASVAAAFALYYPTVIAAEEKRLHATHGAAFADYCARTPRFFPSFRRFHETESVEFRPKFLYRAAGDAAAFAGVWVLMLAINVAHDHGYLPIWLYLY